MPHFRETRNAAPFRTVALFIGYALLHSVLAARPVKRGARRLFGRRAEEGLYRGFYNLVAVSATVGAVLLFVRFPDRTIYRLRGPAAFGFRAMQVVGALLIVDMIRNVGLLRLSGIEQAIGYLRGAEHFPAIEAQGPRYESGAVKITGAFHYTRHPENLGLILLFAAVPRMTVNRLILACFATLYSIAGSLHEDQRLDLAYGESFQRYRRRVPMLLPMSKGLPRNKREW